MIPIAGGCPSKEILPDRTVLGADRLAVISSAAVFFSPVEEVNARRMIPVMVAVKFIGVAFHI